MRKVVESGVKMVWISKPCNDIVRCSGMIAVQEVVIVAVRKGGAYRVM